MDEHDGVLLHSEFAKLESASDPLLDVIGYFESLRPTSLAYSDERFVTWVAREGRVHEDATERLRPQQIAALARRIRAGALAEQSGLQLVDQLPEHMTVRPAWPVSSAVVELAKRRQAVVVDFAIAAGTGRELWDVECEGAIAVPSMLPRGEYLALTVFGDSMDPLLHSGDMILVRRGDELKSGSVVVMRDAEAGYIVKKVGRVEPRSVELLSINPSYPPRRVRRARGAVLGTVLLRWCSHAVT
jgi:SOS-response transcriptional repressor LexA